MLSGGHPIFSDLRFFSAVFLFDNCVCCTPFLLVRLAAAVAVLVVKRTGLNRVIGLLAAIVGDVMAC